MQLPAINAKRKVTTQISAEVAIQTSYLLVLTTQKKVKPP
jgi:hypothetical protein